MVLWWVLSFKLLVLENPALGVSTPRPPVEEQDAKRPGAAPQTPLHKVRSVGSLERFALASPVIDLWVGSIDIKSGVAGLRYETFGRGNS
jgi:hypothetical protein